MLVLSAAGAIALLGGHLRRHRGLQPRARRGRNGVRHGPPRRGARAVRADRGQRAHQPGHGRDEGAVTAACRLLVLQRIKPGGSRRRAFLVAHMHAHCVVLEIIVSCMFYRSCCKRSEANELRVLLVPELHCCWVLGGSESGCCRRACLFFYSSAAGSSHNFQRWACSIF